MRLEKFQVYSSLEESVNHFLNFRIIKESYDKNPEIMLKNIKERGYAGDSEEWLNGVIKVVRQL